MVRDNTVISISYGTCSILQIPAVLFINILAHWSKSILDHLIPDKQDSYIKTYMCIHLTGTGLGFRKEENSLNFQRLAWGVACSGPCRITPRQRRCIVKYTAVNLQSWLAIWALFKKNWNSVLLELPEAKSALVFQPGKWIFRSSITKWGKGREWIWWIFFSNSTERKNPLWFATRRRIEWKEFGFFFFTDSWTFKHSLTIILGCFLQTFE